MRYTTAIALAWLLSTGICLGKQVYLRDGAVIDCESVWRSGNQVLVKVNRDTVLEFDGSEVNQGRTFAGAGKKPGHPGKNLVKKRALHPVAPAMAAEESTKPIVGSSPVPVPPTKPAPQPAAAPAPVAKVPESAPIPAPVVKEITRPEIPQPAVDPKVEQQRKMDEARAMMTDAIRKQDPELLKKAVEAQRAAAMAAGGAPAGQQAQAAAFGLKFLLIMLFFLLLIVASMWVVFQKAGQPGWHSIIPIYNYYVLMEISGKPWWWMFLLFIPVVGIIIYLIAMLSLAQRFGRGAAYGLGLFFLPMFFFPMLAFGGARYEG
jgi:hypothetical protein